MFGNKRGLQQHAGNGRCLARRRAVQGCRLHWAPSGFRTATVRQSGSCQQRLTRFGDRPPLIEEATPLRQRVTSCARGAYCHANPSSAKAASRSCGFCAGISQTKSCLPGTVSKYCQWERKARDPGRDHEDGQNLGVGVSPSLPIMMHRINPQSGEQHKRRRSSPFEKIGAALKPL